MTIQPDPVIRPIQTHAEFNAVEQLQREVWSLPDLGVVPAHLLITAAKNGGLLLGAFDGERLVGFVFGFLGRTADGRLKHCSHMAGVHPTHRDRGLGYALKLAQREHVLAQGLDLVTWTFDPLETRNAHLNFHKLGATCNTYLRNLYGEMSDGLNAGLPSDRFQVDWWVREVPPPHPSHWLADANQVLVEVPSNFQAIKAADMALAVQWRLHTRQLFEDAFAAGYHVVDFLTEAGSCYYLLERTQAK